jgi:hypothetical protein
MVLGFRYTHNRHRGSVLPKIPLQHSREGVRVVASPPGRKEAVMAGCLIAMMTGLILVLIFVAHPSRQVGGIIPTFAIGVGVFELLRKDYVKRKMQRATLLVRPWPLRLGQTATLTFEKRLRRAATVDALTARFVLFEETKASAGKYESTAKEIRREMPLDCDAATRQPGHVSAQWTVEIPASGLPSFTVKSNRVVWQIETRTRTQGIEVPADFELLVVPS